jgi:hypothetical protein
MALLGFIFSSLYLSRSRAPFGGGMLCSQRERGEKEEEEKSPEKTTLPGPGIEPSDS